MGETSKEKIALEEHVPAPFGNGFLGFLGKFTILRNARRELWLTFLIKFLIYTAYSVTNKTMVLWLSKDLGFSDQAAGALIGWVWAPAMTIFTLLAGSLTDAIGLRRTFFFGVAMCTFARSVMILTRDPTVALVCGLLPLSFGKDLRSARFAHLSLRPAPAHGSYHPGNGNRDTYREHVCHTD